MRPIFYGLIWIMMVWVWIWGCNIPLEVLHCEVDEDCRDEVYCNGVETCSKERKCLRGDPVDCSEFETACMLGQCDENTKKCIGMAADEGVKCDDGLYCTVEDACLQGVCRGVERDCSDDQVCTQDLCNEQQQKCDHVWNEIPGKEGISVEGTCGDLLDNDCDHASDIEDVDCQECQEHSQCEDDNPCTENRCENHQCVFGNLKDFTPCLLTTQPFDFGYDICKNTTCVSPGTCDDASCNAPGPDFDLPLLTGQPYTIPIGGKVVIDDTTGLEWKRCPEGLSGESCGAGEIVLATWKNALLICDQLEWADKDDWRLPSRCELQSIVDYSRAATEPAIDPTAFPNTPKAWFWSSSGFAGILSTPYAWYVNFFDGLVSVDEHTSTYRVRCVRDGLEGLTSANREE